MAPAGRKIATVPSGPIGVVTRSIGVCATGRLLSIDRVTVDLGGNPVGGRSFRRDVFSGPRASGCLSPNGGTLVELFQPAAQPRARYDGATSRTPWPDWVATST